MKGSHKTQTCMPLKPVTIRDCGGVVQFLDEATASVDPENEAELQKAIDVLIHNKTIIMIAHRLKTVRNADQILVLNGGKITQRGTHEELSAQSGLYADFIHAREEAASWKLA